MTSIAACALSLQSYLPLDLSITQAKEARAASMVMPHASPAPGANRAYVMRELEDLLAPIQKLTDGWHGSQSVAVSEEVLRRTTEVVACAASAGLPVPEVTPNPHGTITLEWEGKNASLTFEVGKTRKSAVLRTEGNEPTAVADANYLQAEFFAAARSILLSSPSLTVGGTLTNC